MNDTDSRVSAYIRSSRQWKDEFEELRRILRDTPLIEDFKWRHPCYTFGKGNIAIIQDFKDYCALLFPKGALLKDPKGFLVAMTENTQAARQIRFSDAAAIREQEAVVRGFVAEAIEVEKSGMKVAFKDTSDYHVPRELQEELDRDSAFRSAFEGLTPGRQRGYLLHFSQPKQSRTRTARIEKCRPLIFDGLGINGR